MWDIKYISKKNQRGFVEYLWFQVAVTAKANENENELHDMLDNRMFFF